MTWLVRRETEGCPQPRKPQLGSDCTRQGRRPEFGQRRQRFGLARLGLGGWSGQCGEQAGLRRRHGRCVDRRLPRLQQLVRAHPSSCDHQSGAQVAGNDSPQQLCRGLQIQLAGWMIARGGESSGPSGKRTTGLGEMTDPPRSTALATCGPSRRWRPRETARCLPEPPARHRPDPAAPGRLARAGPGIPRRRGMRRHR